MSLKEVLLEALKNGSFSITNCQIVIANDAEMGDFYSQSAASGKQSANEPLELDPKLKSDKAVALMQRLVSNQYCHVEGSCYVWDGKQADYGYMVYIVSNTLGIKHPSSDRILWKAFHPLFLNAKEIEAVAKVAVSNNISPFGNSKAWNNEAKKLKNILEL